MPAALTVAIENLYPGTTKRDIENHFRSLLVASRPAVGPLVPYVKFQDKEDEQGSTDGSGISRKKKRIATTVTFEASNKAACQRARERLHGSRFRPSYPDVAYRSTQISVRSDFLGLYPLNEKPNHQFDFIFLHGLGGKGWRSWALTSGPSKSKVVMWPRDLLPDYLSEDRQLNGRFLTVGYDASPTDRMSALTTIESAANNLISLLAAAREESDNRPLYFAVHSLGGLVLCKAICKALWNIKKDVLKDTSPSQLSMASSVFVRQGLCNIRGIAFFGTPFQGSPVANYMAPVAKIMGKLGRNRDLIPSLIQKDEGLAQIAGEFAQVQNVHNIQVRVFYESLPLYRRFFSFFVTDPESAAGSFGKDVKPIPLNAHHRSLIKFSNDRDANWDRVADEIGDMVSEGQRGLEEIPPLKFPSRSSSVSSGEADYEHHVPSQANGEAIPSLAAARTGILSVNAKKSKLTGLGRARSFGKRSARLFDSQVRQVLNVQPKGVASWRRKSLEPLIDLKDGNIVSHGERATAPEAVAPEFSRILGAVDTVFILDDSRSMATRDIPTNESQGTGKYLSRWQCLVEAVQYFAQFAAKFDDDGIDIHFIINRMLDQQTQNIKKDEDVRNLFRILQSINLPKLKQTPLDAVLRDVFSEYRKRYRALAAVSSRPKPINIIVLTDGMTEDHEKVENTLVRMARTMADMKAPPRQVGVQFVQIGLEESATRWLRTLDDKLRDMHGVRDIVDSRRFELNKNYNANLQSYLRQVLLGAIDSNIDDEEDFPTPMEELRRPRATTL